MESMMTCVTASMANGSKDTTTRTAMFDATMRGEASHTILKIGSVLRSAASRSFQRGTGLACSEPNVPQPRLKAIPPLTPLPGKQAQYLLCLRSYADCRRARKRWNVPREARQLVLKPTRAAYIYIAPVVPTSSTFQLTCFVVLMSNRGFRTQSFIL